MTATKEASATAEDRANSFRPEFGTVYSFTGGRMVPVKAAGLLPVGQIVTYSDMANPRKEFVVTGAEFGHIGQACTCEDGHSAEVSRNAVEGIGGWQLGNRILDAEEIAVFLYNAKLEAGLIATERAQAKQTRAEADEAARAKYATEYAHLERLEGSKKSQHALAAANLRKMLKIAFPSVKFAITSKSFSMGNDVSVSWTDGPTTEQVDKIADRFQTCDFNGMDDSTSYRHSVFSEMFGGAKYVMCSREVSGARYLAVSAEMGYPGATVNEWGGLETSATLTFEIAEMIKRETWKRAFGN